MQRDLQELAQCPALAHLDLNENYNFGAAASERLAGVLGQCTVLTHLNLRANDYSGYSQGGGGGACTAS
jgi:Ran GTPase-activating protein (RanGAP) involved in mRNA processing and transport